MNNLFKSYGLKLLICLSFKKVGKLFKENIKLFNIFFETEDCNALYFAPVRELHMELQMRLKLLYIKRASPKSQATPKNTVRIFGYG